MIANVSKEKVNILLVDDRPDKLLALETVLNELNENLIKVSSGADALRALLKDEYALVILDVSMPIMDGFETASLIRQRKRTEHTPIIFVTGVNTTETHVSRGYELGAVDYIFAPVDPAMLRSKASVFIDLYRKTNQIRWQSEQLRAEAETRAHDIESRMQGLLNRLNVGVFRISREGELLEANPALLRLTKCGSIKEINEREPKLVKFIAECAAKRNSEDSESHDILLERLDGSTIWVSVSTFIDSSKEWLEGIIEDVSTRKESEEVLRKNESALLEADRRKDEFIAMLGHELRNPLNAIHGATQLLDRPGMEASRNLHTGIITRQVKQLTRIIDDLLDVSRITRGKIQLKKEELLLTPLVHAAIHSVKPFLEQRRHTLSVSLPSEEIWINADPTRIEQILVNLLNNAGKYTPEGGKIQLSISASPDSAVMKVQDNGSGIRPDVIPHIFELFSQAERTLDRSQGGLGIGLTLVQKLTALHAGDVTAESDGPGKGSVFTVTLPRVLRQPKETPNQAVSVPADAPRLRIMIVEDHLDSAELTCQYLLSYGHQVHIVSKSTEAVDQAKSFHPDLILLDIGLPELNGYEVAERIRKEEDLKGVLLVAVSGYGQESDKRQSYQSGFDYHLVKPLNYDYLLDELLPSFQLKTGSREPTSHVWT